AMTTGHWVMQLVAFRALSGGSDTQPPTTPGNLTVTSTTSQNVNLSWTASTDNVGVNGYGVERCLGSGCTNFVQVGYLPSGTTYADAGLPYSTTSVYRVRATDGINFSGYSGSVTAATTPPVPPTVIITVPSAGAQLSGNATLTATVTGEAPIGGLQFQV